MITQFSLIKNPVCHPFYPILFFCLIHINTSYAIADEPVIAPPIDTIEGADSIEATLKQRDTLDNEPTRRSLFPDWYNRYHDWRQEIDRKFGLESTLSYDMLGQGYAASSWSQGAASGEVSFTTRWLIFGEKHNKPTFLSFRMRHRHAYGNIAPSQLGASTHLLWKTVDGFSDAGFQIPDFYISQELADNRLTLLYGQFSIDKFFDNHRLRSAKRFFLNQIFSANPAVAFPSYGAGFSIQWKDTRNWDFSIGGSNIQGADGDSAIDLNLDSSSLFYAAQGSTIFTGFDNHDSRLQLMVWQSKLDHDEVLSDEFLSDGNGASLTLEHEGFSSADHFVARIAFAEGNASLVDRLLMLGWGKENRKFNNFGIGIGIGRSAIDTNDWQGVTEIYYRWQVTKELMITPDLQVIIGDGLLNDEDNIHIVAGLRGGLTF